MIKDKKLLREFEDDFMRVEKKLSYTQAIRLFTDMWNEGVKLGVLPPKNPSEGIDVDVRIAKVLNSCSKKSSQE